MRSVADRLRLDDCRGLTALDAADRLLRRRRQDGRRPARCLRELIG